MSIRNKKHKLSGLEIYGKIPVYKTMLKVALPAFFMGFASAFFIFINYFLLIKFMPLTSNFSFNELFNRKDLFNNLINLIQDNKIQKLIISNPNDYKNFINYLAYVNNLHFYNTEETIRIAISLISPIFFLINAVPILLLPGSNVLFSNAISIRNKLKEVKVWQNEFYTSLFITLLGIVLIIILNYLMIPAMIKDALNENVTTNDVQNLSNNKYWYEFKNNQLIFIIYQNNHYYNFINHELIQSNSINNFQIINHSLIANTFSNYYYQVGKYSISWAQNYIILISCFLWIINIVYTNINLIRNYGKTILIALLLISTICLNIFLDWIFIYYADIGLLSPAVSTIISYSICLSCLMFYANYLTKKGIIFVSYKNLYFKNVMWNFNIIKEMLFICLSSIVKYICYMLVQVLLINQISYVTAVLYPNLGGLYFISIMGAVLPILNFFYNPISGFMATGTTIIAYNYGIKEYKRINMIVFESSLFIFLYGLSVLLLVGFCSPISDFFLNIFGIKNTTNKILYECARRFLWISLMIMPIRGIGNGAYMLTRTTKRYLQAVFVAILRSFIIIVPMLYIFSDIALNSSIPIKNILLAKNNPIFNPNIWILLWTQSASIITSNIITIIWIIYFLYKEIYKEKTIFTKWKINKKINKIYLKSLLNESHIK